MIKSSEEGNKKFNLSYMLNGMRWNAKYNMTLSDNEKSGMLISWIQLNNNSGKDFDGVRLQLMAGDVRRTGGRRVEKSNDELMMAVDQEETVSEESMMEYHLYTVGRKISIGPRQNKELPFFETVRINVEKD